MPCFSYPLAYSYPVSYTHLDVYKRQDGTYTEQGDLLYIFTIDEGDIVTTQYYIVKDYGFCLIQLTNFSGSETTEQAARDMVDSFVWDTEG